MSRARRNVRFSWRAVGEGLLRFAALVFDCRLAGPLEAGLLLPRRRRDEVHVYGPLLRFDVAWEIRSRLLEGVVLEGRYFRTHSLTAGDGDQAGEIEAVIDHYVLGLHHDSELVGYI